MKKKGHPVRPEERAHHHMQSKPYQPIRLAALHLPWRQTLVRLLECMGATERRCKQQRPTQRRRGNNTSFRLVYKWEHQLKPEWRRIFFVVFVFIYHFIYLLIIYLLFLLLIVFFALDFSNRKYSPPPCPSPVGGGNTFGRIRYEE